jgi:hypothetical protein
MVGACTALLLMIKRLLVCCTLAAEDLLLRCMMVDCMITDYICAVERRS